MKELEAVIVGVPHVVTVRSEERTGSPKKNLEVLEELKNRVTTKMVFKQHMLLEPNNQTMRQTITRNQD